MRVAAALAGLSALILLLSFLRDVLKEDGSDRRKWRATVFLGGMLLLLNVAVIGGNWLYERTREEVAKQLEAEQSASAIRLHQSLQSLRDEASGAFERLERALASRQHNASAKTLNEEAQRVKASLSGLTESTKSEPSVLARKLEETRRAVRSLNDALDVRGIARTHSDQARAPGREMPDRSGTQLPTTERPAGPESHDDAPRRTRREAITDAGAPARAVVVPIVVPSISGSPPSGEQPSSASLQGLIQTPQSHSHVPLRFPIGGIVSGRVRHLWVTVRFDDHDVHWPQEPELQPAGDKWAGEVYMGGPPGREFQLLLVDVSDEVSTRFREWLETGRNRGLPVTQLGFDTRTLDAKRYRYVP